ncbi:unnamed protein product, partial [Candidula unifasciata]
TVSGTECNGQNEGKIVDRGCWGYAKCVNGEVVVTSCPSGSVFDVVSRKCVEREGRTENCGLCDGKSDGVYADLLDDCNTFFTCNSGQAGELQSCLFKMVYDEATLKCNIPDLVRPPCGTRGQ